MNFVLHYIVIIYNDSRMLHFLVCKHSKQGMPQRN